MGSPFICVARMSRNSETSYRTRAKAGITIQTDFNDGRHVQRFSFWYAPEPLRLRHLNAAATECLFQLGPIRLLGID